MRTHASILVVTLAASMAVLIPGDAAAQGGGQKGKDTGAKQVQFKMGPVTGNASNGKKLYFAHTCYGCHGFNGETGARDLVGRNSPILANEETFVLYLRQRADQAPILPSTSMPNFSEASLPDKDAKDIYAFIRSFRLNAPKIEDVATLRKILESAEKPYKP